MNAKPLFATLLVAGVLWGVDSNAVSDLVGKNVRYRSIVGKLKPEEFVQASSEVLGAAEITLGAIANYTSEHDRLLAGPLGGDHCGYESWRGFINANSHPGEGCPAVREATKIGSSVILRTLTSDCRVSSKLLMGKSDPLTLVVGDKQVQILASSYGRPIGGASEHSVSVSLYVRVAGEVSVAIAKAVATEVSSITGVRNLGVVLRSDPWFFGDCMFPAVFPFEMQPTVPSKADYTRTRYASCVVLEGFPIRCFEAASGR